MSPELAVYVLAAAPLVFFGGFFVVFIVALVRALTKGGRV